MIDSIKHQAILKELDDMDAEKLAALEYEAYGTRHFASKQSKRNMERQQARAAEAIKRKWAQDRMALIDYQGK